MNNIKRLLELNIEIEGLLRVAEYRNSETIESLLISKAKQFIEILNSDIAGDKSESDITKTIPSDIESKEEDRSVDITATLIMESNISSPIYSPVIAESSSVVSEEMETMLELENETNEKPEEDTVTSTLPPVFIPSIQQQSNEQEEISTEISLPSEDDGHVMRIDEMIHRQSSRNLKKAFSINDRFRYIREIFDNDSAYFDETVKNLELLSNIDEVYDYLLGDMGLNHEDQTVKEFLSIIYNHFNVSDGR